MEDNFRPTEGYPGYRVSSSGEVQSCWVRRGRVALQSDSWRTLKPIYRRRYLTVNLTRGSGSKTSRSIHSLVLEAFVGPRPQGMVCCHADGDPANNDLSNLRWDTHQANCDDKLRHGTLCRGEAARHARLRESDVMEIRRLRTGGCSVSSLADRFRTSHRNVRTIVQGRTWKHLLLYTGQPGDVDIRKFWKVAS